MIYRLLIISILALSLIACNSKNQTADIEHQHDEAVADDGHNHQTEPIKLQYTVYNSAFELFVEADPFVLGQSTNVLSHFSHLPSFKALERGEITLSIITKDQEVKQTLTQPLRKGIYSFDIVPKYQGRSKLIFDIKTENGLSQIVVPYVFVYADVHDAMHIEQAQVSMTNTIAFTKEQAWKIDFATERVEKRPFGQTIKTTARLMPSQSDEVLLSAKTNGNVVFVADHILEGKKVKNGDLLFAISSNGYADNNTEVRFIEARNNFQKAKSNFERMTELAKDKIVSDRVLIDATAEYENAKVVYENLNKNFNASGQKAISPISGSVKQVFVKNGQYVEQGQSLISLAKNEKMILSAEIQQKYAPLLSSINTATIRPSYGNKTYTLEELNGEILSFSMNTNDANYLIPVHLQIDNTIKMLAGSFVEVYLKAKSNTEALTVANSALLEEQGFFFVFVQVTPELFEKREVAVGSTDGLRTEIISGIEPNERVVTKGAVLIKLAQSTGSLDAHSGHVH